VAGECYEDPQKYIKLIDSLGLTDRIILDFNYKTKIEIQELFSASDIVAQTYHTATQSGVTPIAYHYQKPLLVSNIDGLRDPILKDQSGVVVEKNNLAIAEGIVSLLEKKQWEAYVEQIKKSSPQYRWSSFVTQWNAFVSETKIKSS
jgi:glycosyltransferase involved in cell wall biosynthesis